MHGPDSVFYLVSSVLAIDVAFPYELSLFYSLEFLKFLVYTGIESGETIIYSLFNFARSSSDFSKGSDAIFEIPSNPIVDVGESIKLGSEGVLNALLNAVFVADVNLVPVSFNGYFTLFLRSSFFITSFLGDEGDRLLGRIVLPSKLF
jgi:hypothetical protein